MAFSAMAKAVKPAMPQEFVPFLDRMEDGLPGTVTMQPLQAGTVPEVPPFDDGFPPQLALLHRDLHTLAKKGPWGAGKGVLTYELKEENKDSPYAAMVTKRIWIYDDQGRLRICAFLKDSPGPAAFHIETVWGLRWTDGPQPKIAAVFEANYEVDEGLWSLRLFEAKAK